MSSNATTTITVKSLVEAYGEIEVPAGLSREALRAFVRQAYEVGNLSMSIDWGTEQEVAVQSWTDPATGETCDMPLYGDDPNARPEMASGS